MNNLEEKMVVEQLLSAEWPTPIFFENTFADNTLSEWARATILQAQSSQVTLGDNPEFRVYSTLFLQIFTKKNIGSGRAMQLADEAVNLLRNLDTGGLRFLVPQISRSNDSGEWFQINVSTMFYRGA